MKFISLQDNLKKALNIVGNISIKNINLPILNNILIKTYKNNEVEFISTNLEIAINYKTRAKVEKEGEFTVDSKIINDYINLVPGEKVLLKKNENELLVECDNYKTKIKGESAKEFPLIPIIKKDKFCLLDLNIFRKALTKVSFAASVGDNRPELSGILFNFLDNNLVLTATDSYRLAEQKILIKKNNLNNKKIIIPVKTIQELLRVLNNLQNNENEIKICLSENQILFDFNGVNIISRLINGNYPDYEQIIPINYKTEVKINKEELIRAVKAASLFTKTGINDLILVFYDNKVSVSSSSGQSGETNINLKAEIKGEKNEIIINYRYLLDGLNNLDSENIIINLIDSQTPCLLKSEKEEEYLYIIMPIRQ
jgi:DNA polymerase III subunit beta